MNHVQDDLVIALCTRDRPDDLLRACRSISRSCLDGGVRPLHALVLEGGTGTTAVADEVVSTLGPAVRTVEYLDVAERSRSLYQSRLIALRRARELGARWVAFFDDDVELLPDYMPRLVDVLRDTGAALVGGVDVDLRPPRSAARAWARFSGVSSGDPARLSSSGFSGSMYSWPAQPEPFLSEYVSGCCMTIATAVLDELPGEAEHRFETYSVGEDLYLSARAAALGMVLVDPRLKVRHHRSPRAREGRLESGRQLVMNHAWLRTRLHPPRARVAFLWTLAWIAVRALVEDVRMRQVRGRTVGILHGALGSLGLLVRR